MKNIFRRTLCIILAFVCLFLTGCSSKISSADQKISIGSVQIDREIHSYYLDIVTNKPGDYGLTDAGNADALNEKANELCIRHLAVNSDFNARKLHLTPAEKIEISEKVNNYYLRFSNHYNKIGVSRQTLSKIFTNEAFEEKIFNTLYDKGNTSSASEAEIKNYFFTHYVSFKTVCTYFSSDGKKATEQEKLDINNEFNAMKSEYNEDVENPSLEFDRVVESHGYTSSDNILLKKDSNSYPTGFFEKVLYMKDNSMSIANYDECVFAIFKNSSEDIGESVYSSYRDSCISDMYQEQWKTYLEALCEQIK